MGSDWVGGFSPQWCEFGALSGAGRSDQESDIGRKHKTKVEARNPTQPNPQPPTRPTPHPPTHPPTKNSPHTQPHSASPEPVAQVVPRKRKVPLQLDVPPHHLPPVVPLRSVLLRRRAQRALALAVHPHERRLNAQPEQSEARPRRGPQQRDGERGGRGEEEEGARDRLEEDAAGAGEELGGELRGLLLLLLLVPMLVLLLGARVVLLVGPIASELLAVLMGPLRGRKLLHCVCVCCNGWLHWPRSVALPAMWL